MTGITVPSISLPPLVKLEGNCHNLYHYKVETKKDLVNIVRHLTIVVSLNPTTQGRMNAVFEANGKLYYVRVDVDGNPRGEYFIERTLYQCVCDDTSELITWYDWYVEAEDERYGFDEVWEVLNPEPLYIKCPRSPIDGCFIPEGIGEGDNHYLDTLSRMKGFSTLINELKD